MSVDVERRGPVTVVTINRPQAANALDGPTMSGLGHAFEQAEKEDDVRAVILTAAGDRTFCAGMDLKAFLTGSISDISGPGIGIFTKRTFPKPIIGAINGTALGGGFELALGCDLLVAAETARFGLPEVSRGLIAAGGGTRLPQRIPLALALELGLTGAMVSAARLGEMGLVNRVVPAAEVLSTALDLAGQIAANGPLAVRVTKELMVGELAAADWDGISAAVAPVFGSADAREGARAFAEKRAPRWIGR
ncbi:Enoyl-CoA hydratase/isomerase [Parafrankia sp. EAN1pec]|uniref:enoyl-CoA hydratase-related protein n=1 Tax=Parafrankia sp. (strain EAN1pec) TaxID=298653 RepID=UPI0000544382|nr:Enoyl-CoA hydratase/isomerase [Frankia sp. EAN1pec]